ncbi:MAG: type 4a pilus biogenesis protein PilO [Pseudomonadota bacterium]
MSVEQKFQQFLASFSNLNLSNPGSWPLVVKLTIYLAAFGVVMVLAYTLVVSEKNAQLSVAQGREAELLKSYEEKAFKAMNLDAYKKQLADMEEAFGALLRQLPKDTEVPSLLEDINHTGLGSGLSFTTIDLGVETRRDFYAELPINITVTGDYHGFGSFVSGVAALPRIVTLHDFKLTPAKSARTSKKDSGRGPRLLEMTILAKTYRYSDASEAPAKGKGKGQKKKGK